MMMFFIFSIRIAFLSSINSSPDVNNALFNWSCYSSVIFSLMSTSPKSNFVQCNPSLSNSDFTTILQRIETMYLIKSFKGFSFYRENFCAVMFIFLKFKVHIVAKMIVYTGYRFDKIIVIHTILVA